MGFPGGSNGKESACNVGDRGLIPGWGRSPGGRHDNPLQYSWRIPWTKKPGELQSVGEESDMIEQKHIQNLRVWKD